MKRLGSFMKREEKTEATPSVVMDQRLKELELKVKYQEVEKQLAREEGRRDGIKYTIEVVAIVLTILVAAGLATLWSQTRSFQEKTLTNIKSTIDSSAASREAILFEDAQTRQAEVKATTDFRMETLVSGIGTRAFDQESKRVADVGTRAAGEIGGLATTASQRVAEIAGTADAHNQEIAQQSEIVGATAAAFVLDAVGTAVGTNVDPEALQAVAITILQTRTIGIVEDSFEQSVEQAVVATTDALMLTATAAATPTATPTP